MPTSETGHHANRFYIDQDGNPHLNGSSFYIDESGTIFSTTEIGFVDGVTAGTGAASKALVLDANGDVTMPDLGNIAFGGVFSVSWDTTDANANQAHIQLPTGGSVDVPVLVIGQGIDAVDSARYDAIVDPTIAVYGIGAVTTGPVIEIRKSRGTFASPTVCTTGDDIGHIDFYGCVAAGEYVRGASIQADIAGTIATTRGPGTLSFFTATDAAPSVLTRGLLISAAQNITIGGGAATQTLTFDNSGTDVTITCTSAALAFGAITLNVTGTRFVQSYHTNLTSTNAVTVDSSETVKHDINRYDRDALALVAKMNVVTFRHDEWLDPSGAERLGIIAESVNEPLAVEQIDRGNGQSYPGVNMYGLAAINTRAIQQLRDENTRLMERLAKLEARLASH